MKNQRKLLCLSLLSALAMSAPLTSMAAMGLTQCPKPAASTAAPTGSAAGVAAPDRTQDYPIGGYCFTASGPGTVDQVTPDYAITSDGVLYQAPNQSLFLVQNGAKVNLDSPINWAPSFKLEKTYAPQYMLFGEYRYDENTKEYVDKDPSKPFSQRVIFMVHSGYDVAEDKSPVDPAPALLVAQGQGTGPGDASALNISQSLYVLGRPNGFLAQADNGGQIRLGGQVSSEVTGHVRINQQVNPLVQRIVRASENCPCSELINNYSVRNLRNLDTARHQDPKGVKDLADGYQQEPTVGQVGMTIQAKDGGHIVLAGVVSMMGTEGPYSFKNSNGQNTNSQAGNNANNYQPYWYSPYGVVFDQGADGHKGSINLRLGKGSHILLSGLKASEVTNLEIGIPVRTQNNGKRDELPDGTPYHARTQIDLSDALVYQMFAQSSGQNNEFQSFEINKEGYAVSTILKTVYTKASFEGDNDSQHYLLSGALMTSQQFIDQNLRDILRRFKGQTFTINGNYYSHGGSDHDLNELIFNTQLGGDDSKTNRLLIKGIAKGATKVTVVNLGGKGALTDRGIELIRVENQSVVTPGGKPMMGSDSDFLDPSAPSFRLNGTPEVGAYEYYLAHEKSGASDVWFLRSNMRPIAAEFMNISLQINTGLNQNFNFNTPMAFQKNAFSVWVQPRFVSNWWNYSGVKTESYQNVISLGADVFLQKTPQQTIYRFGVMSNLNFWSAKSTAQGGDHHEATGNGSAMGIGIYWGWYNKHTDWYDTTFKAWVTYNFSKNSLSDRNDVSRSVFVDGFIVGGAYEGNIGIKSWKLSQGNLGVYWMPRLSFTYMGASLRSPVLFDGNLLFQSSYTVGQMHTGVGIGAIYLGDPGAKMDRAEVSLIGDGIWPLTFWGATVSGHEYETPFGHAHAQFTFGGKVRFMGRYNLGANIEYRLASDFRQYAANLNFSMNF